MADITIRPEQLRPVANSCESIVAPQVDVAKRAFTDGESGSGGAGMSAMQSAAPAHACVSNWLRAFRDGSRTMHALSTKLANTAAIVVSTDADAADLYRGPVDALPKIDLTLNLSE